MQFMILYTIIWKNMKKGLILINKKIWKKEKKIKKKKKIKIL